VIRIRRSGFLFVGFCGEQSKRPISSPSRDPIQDRPGAPRDCGYAGAGTRIKDTGDLTSAGQDRLSKAAFVDLRIICPIGLPAWRFNSALASIHRERQYAIGHWLGAVPTSDVSHERIRGGGGGVPILRALVEEQRDAVLWHVVKRAWAVRGASSNLRMRHFAKTSH